MNNKNAEWTEDDEERLVHYLDRWRETVSDAIMTYIRKREPPLIRNLPSDATVRFAKSSNHHLNLLNLKGWCTKYTVDLSFVISVLIERYCRDTIRYIPQMRCVALGRSHNILTGVAARRYLEEQITKHYPDGENITMKRQALVESMFTVLDGHADIDSPEYLREYARVAKRNQRRANRIQGSRRSWRGNPWQE